MTGPIDPSGPGGTLAEVVAALGRAQAPSGDQDEPEPPIGTGEAADGRIRVRAALPGRIADLGALTDQLKDIQFDAERQFAKLTASLVEAQEQLTRRAGDR
jgi:hypothetical protein